MKTRSVVLNNRPTVAPQYPNLLRGFLVRPPWAVAGVHYPVGVPAGTTLRNPAGLSMTGVTVNAGSHIVSITGNDVMLSGWDFSLNGGWLIEIDGNNVVVKNCRFAAGSNGLTCLFVGTGTTNVTVQDCTFDGGGTTFNVQILVGCNGSALLQRNLIEDCYGQNVVFSSTGGGGGETLTLRQNVITNAGWGFAEGAHGDWVQTYNADGVNTDNVSYFYNTFIQDIPIASGRTQGISAFSANSGPSAGAVNTENIDFNTFVANGGSYVNYAIIVDTTRLITSATIRNNYFDTTNIGSANGGGGDWSFVGDFSGGSGGPYSGSVTISGNIEMLTGATLT